MSVIPPPHPLALPAILLGYCFKWLFGWLKRPPKPFYVDYFKLSEARLQEARGRADVRGFIYLGTVKRHMCYDLVWNMAGGRDVACRFEGGELRFYALHDVEAFLSGGDEPELLDAETVELSRVKALKAWYVPCGDGGFEIDLGELPEFGRDYVLCGVKRDSRRLMTDAMVLVYERSKCNRSLI